MLEKAPTKEQLLSLLGQPLYEVWVSLNHFIESKYEMDQLWNDGGKHWTYEYKYRRGGKTLCTLYAKESVFGLLIIFGKQEREKFEANKEDYSAQIQRVYDESTTYHDGKWMIFQLEDRSLFFDIGRLLQIKRKPNRK